MPIKVLETLNWPGAGLTGAESKLTGDDRFGYDETVGTAWVIDGATDVGEHRLFDTEESDAAWIAETLSQELSSLTPDGDVRAYFAMVLAGLRARAEQDAIACLETAPKACLPVAAGMWMWVNGDQAHFAHLGDCEALIAVPGHPTERLQPDEDEDRETQSSLRLNALSPEARIAGLRRERAMANEVPERAPFGLTSHTLANLKIETHDFPVGAHALLMSDGLWRLVAPYGLMTAQDLMASAIGTGIEPLAQRLRTFEQADAHDASIRIKKTDDACGVLLQRTA